MFRSFSISPNITNEAVNAVTQAACSIRSSLLSSVDFSSHEQNAALDIMNKIETLLFDDILRTPGTIPLNGESLAKLFLALAYSRTSWSELDNMVRIALLDSIDNHYYTMTAKAVGNIWWAFARMGCTTKHSEIDYNLNEDTIQTLMQVTVQTSDEASHQTIANTLWSFAVLDLNFNDIEPALRFYFEKIKTEHNQDPFLNKFNDFEIRQLVDFFEYYEKEFPKKWQIAILTLTSSLRIRLSRMEKPESSASHLQFAKTVKQCSEFEFKIEFPIAGGYADICFPQKKCVFEFNGPYHETKKGELDAHTRFRQRMMERCGFTVYHIHYRAWQTAKNKKEFVRNLLLNAGLEIKKEPSPLVRFMVFIPPPSSETTLTITIPKPLKRTQDDANISGEDRDFKRSRISPYLESESESDDSLSPGPSRSPSF